MTTAQVSVITVVRNGEKYLAQAIDSIRRQTTAALEVIVVDGQSTDATPQIARSHQNVRYVCQPTKGLAKARNLGLALATGDLIAFLDHDDLWHQEKLARQLDAFAGDPALQYVTTRMQFQVEQGCSRQQLSADLQRPRGGCTPSALLARRQLFADLGAFDPRFAIGCDADWFTRARDRCVPHKMVPEVLLYKRLHGSNLSVDFRRNRQEMFSIARQSVSRRSL